MNYYEIVGVLKTTDRDQIIVEYKKKCEVFHPENDKGNIFEGKFKELFVATYVLTNLDIRKLYDKNNQITEKEKKIISKYEEKGKLIADKLITQKMINSKHYDFLGSISFLDALFPDGLDHIIITDPFDWD